DLFLLHREPSQVETGDPDRSRSHLPRSKSPQIAGIYGRRLSTKFSCTNEPVSCPNASAAMMMHTRRNTFPAMARGKAERTTISRRQRLSKVMKPYTVEIAIKAIKLRMPPHAAATSY